VTDSPALGAYLALSRLAGPVAAPILRARARRGKEDPARLAERLGHACGPRPDGRLIWLHGASVGEAVSMLALIAALMRAAPASRLLVTTGTVTAAARMAADLPAGVLHRYAPVDTAVAVDRFLDAWRPDLAIRVESEIWPRILVETARRGTPLALVNARLSAASARGWGRVPAMARRLFALFDLIVTQDEATRLRLEALGADPARLRSGANLKSAVPVPGCDAEALAAARAALAGRAVWLAASTHPGEEEAVAAAAAALGPGPLLILAPRHPARGDAIAAMLRARGLRLARHSRGETPEAATDVWLADTLGEMGLWYRLAAVAFIGGSLVEKGGHTPFEPAALGPAILHGPHVANFAPSYAALAAAGGAREVTDADELAAALAALMEDAGARSAMAGAAAAVRREMTPDLDAMARDLLALMRAGT